MTHVSSNTPSNSFTFTQHPSTIPLALFFTLSPRNKKQPAAIATQQEPCFTHTSSHVTTQAAMFPLVNTTQEHKGLCFSPWSHAQAAYTQSPSLLTARTQHNSSTTQLLFTAAPPWPLVPRSNTSTSTSCLRGPLVSSSPSRYKHGKSLNFTAKNHDGLAPLMAAHNHCTMVLLLPLTPSSTTTTTTSMTAKHLDGLLSLLGHVEQEQANPLLSPFCSRSHTHTHQWFVFGSLLFKQEE